MSMTFDDMLETAMADLATEMGQPAVYRPAPGGTAVSIPRATFAESPPADRSDPDRRLTRRTASATVPASLVSSPAVGGTLTIAGETWAIAAVRPVAARSRWELSLEAGDVHETVQPRSRRNR